MDLKYRGRNINENFGKYLTVETALYTRIFGIFSSYVQKFQLQISKLFVYWHKENHCQILDQSRQKREDQQTSSGAAKTYDHICVLNFQQFFTVVCLQTFFLYQHFIKNKIFQYMYNECLFDEAIINMKCSRVSTEESKRRLITMKLF